MAPPDGYNPNAPIPDADWGDPNSALFNDPSFNHGNWRFNKETGQWEVGNANMDVSNAVTGTVAPGSTAFVSSSDPGATLDTNASQDDRGRMAGYLSQLQGQARTGGGAWEQALAQNTHANQQNAQALSQTAGLDPMNAAMNAGNAQAGAAQRAVGQGNLLRAQTQQQAMGQIASVLGGQGALDAGQAATSAAVNQGVREVNNQAVAAGKKGTRDMLGAAGQTMMMGLSDGGTVPGQAKVFGDDERNDTVPAKLSPGEIVIPRSITEQPNAAHLAAAFVEAIKAQGPSGSTHFDGGGVVPTRPESPTSSLTDPTPLPEGQLATTATYPVEPSDPMGKQKPTIDNGGLLDLGDYNQTRDATLGNADRFMEAFQGKGPSVAPQAMQNATDATIADAMRAQAGARHPMDVTGAATEHLQGGAGNAAGLVAGESQRAGDAFVQAVQRQRAQDLAVATAKQQAAWRNTQMNMGIGLEQQNQLKSLLGAAGTGAVATASLFGESPPTVGGGYKGYDSGDMDLGGGKIYDDEMGKAHGGEIGYAEGGVVGYLSRQGTRPKATRPGRIRQEGDEPRGPFRPGPGEGDASEWTPFEGREAPKRNMGTVREKQGEEQSFADGGAVEPSRFEQLRAFLAGGGSSPVNFEGTSAPPVPGSLFGPEMTPALLAEQDKAKAAMAAKQQGERGMSLASLPPMREAPPVAPVATKSMPAPMPARPVAAKPMAPAAPRPPDQFDLQRKAAEERAQLETDQGKEQANVLSGLQDQMQANAVQQAEIQARAKEAAGAQMTQLQQARDEMKAINVSVDPDRFMASRGWGGKIAAIIGLALGAIGNDNGNNRAAALLGQQIDRDLAAQKAEHELALRKGQSAVDSAQNVYQLSRQMFGDDIAANAAAKGTMLDLAINQVKLAQSRFAAPEAKAKLDAFLATLSGQKAELDTAAARRAEDMGLKWYGAKTDRMQAERPAAGANTLTANFVAPGYALADGAHPKPEELEKWRAARAGADDVKGKATALRQMISSGELSGTDRFSGEKRAKAEALIGSMKVAAKEAFALGAISGSDMDLVMSQIADPTGVTGLFSRDKTMMKKLDQFIDNADQTVIKKGDALGIVKATPQTTQAPTSDAAPTATGKDGRKYRLSPDGKSWVSAP